MKAPFNMGKRRYAVLACLSAFALVVGGAVAVAGPPPDKGNSGATITGEFSDSCRDFEAHSSKDISHVEIHYADGRVVKDESVESKDYSIDEGPGDEKTHVFVKSGTTEERFDCDGGGGDDPECSDGVDNDGDKAVDFPDDPGCDSADDDSEDPNPECSDGVDNDGDKAIDADDPECHTDGDPKNPDSYDPRDDDESNGNGDPECSDGVDNDGDGFVDFPDDPGCDSGDDDSESPNPQCSDGVDNDGDGFVDFPGDPGCDDLRDDDETNNGGGAFSCRASALRIDGSPLGAVIGDPFEPFVANDAKSPCADEDASLINTGDQISGPPGTLTIKVAHATTEDDNGADAEAGVANVILKDETGAVLLRAGVANANATGRCADGQPVLDGKSEIVGLNINGNEVTIPQDDPATPEDESFTEIPLGPAGTVFLNWEDDSGNELTRRAIFVEGSPLGDVIIGEAIADFSDNPC